MASPSLSDLIPLVNKLQDLVFNTIGSDTLDLPQVVVVGSQSCGKSSVLENIVGRDFLPRGTGIVTRRPLILQLVNIPAANQTSSPSSFTDTTGGSVQPHVRSTAPAQYEEWGEFLHVPGQRFYDFNQIRHEIEAETSRVAGTNKGVNRIPINLKVYSPHVLNLTLVDLPGLMKIPIGDQPTDIEKQTRIMILEYIAKPNAIILAVSPANVDLVNSESLKLARQVDPEGRRTIGVLSKLDLMDRGTNALDILSGTVYPLKLGFVGVVNRSQQDIQSSKPLSDSLIAEREFFAQHPAYKNIAHKCGTAFLAKTLNQTLMLHIKERLPDIKAKLNTLMGQTEQELASYGDPSIADNENKAAIMLDLMTKFANSFVSSIDGTSTDIKTKELCGGARIYYIYNEVFGTSLSTLNPVANLSIQNIRTAIRNSMGPRPSLFVPELAFDLLVKPQIKMLEAPSLRCVELVYEELMKICYNCGSPELSRYPRLQAKLIETVSDLLRERLGPTSSYVSSLIAIQKAYINTNHPKFLGTAAAMSRIMEERKENARRQQEIKTLASTRDSSPDATEGSPTTNGSASSKHSNSKKGHKNSASSVYSEANGSVAASAVTGHHSTTSFGNTTGPGKDNFLNFFFGKDAQAVNGVAATASSSTTSHLHVNGNATGPAGFRPHTETGGADTNASAFRFDNFGHDLDQTLHDDDSSLSEQELLECELISRLIVSYFEIVREIIQDIVPKSIMHLLVNFTKEGTQNRLVSKLYKDSMFEDLLQEDENLAEERKKCVNMLKTYREAAKIIGDVV